MTVNRTSKTIDNRLVNEIAHLRRELTALKTRQLIGGDNLVIEHSAGVHGSFNLLPGEHINFVVTLKSIKPTSSLFPIVLSSIYVGVDNDPDYLWPTGAMLDDDIKRKIRITYPHHEWAASDPESGYHEFVGQIYHGIEALVAFDVFLHFRFYYPAISV